MRKLLCLLLIAMITVSCAKAQKISFEPYPFSFTIASFDDSTGTANVSMRHLEGQGIITFDRDSVYQVEFDSTKQVVLRNTFKIQKFNEKVLEGGAVVYTFEANERAFMFTILRKRIQGVTSCDTSQVISYY